MKNRLLTLLAILLMLAIMASGIYGMWLVGRHFNYSVSYESMVRDTVRDMVKENALK